MDIEGSNSMELDYNFIVDTDQELGRGRTGIVYKGFDRVSKRIVAVKFISRRIAQVFDWQRQLQIMKTLSKFKHNNIMEFLGYKNMEHGLYFFMQFCDGGQLHKYIFDKNARISELKALDLLQQILSAMSYLNQQNIVHRDLKPQNIFLDENHNIKIGDYGIARQIDIRMTKKVGTPIYSGPQVVFHQEYDGYYDKRCDVWSTGIMLYEILMGSEFFPNIQQLGQLKSILKQMEFGIKTIKLSPNLDSEWKNLIDKMLTYNYKYRPTFHEMLQIFQEKKPEMMKRIRQKYQIEQNFFDNNDDIRITNSVNPYINNSQRSEMIEETSYKNLINLRKYLTHFRVKATFLRILSKQFSTYKYDILRNVQKYLLMLLGGAAYVSRIQKHIKNIQNLTITMPDKQLKFQDFSPPLQQKIGQLQKKTIQQHKKSIQKYKQVLAKQISQKILDKYLTQHSEKIAQICEDIGNIIEYTREVNNRIYRDENYYMSMYYKMIKRKNLHISNQLLDELTYQQLKVYCCIRVIYYLDQIFEEKMYQRQDYALMKKQQILNMSKVDLIKLISEINL